MATPVAAQRQLQEASTLEEIFGPAGVLERRLPGYENRPSQLQMAQSVLEAIREDRTLCVEAGTGTGKTLAYLIPALFCQKRVIVSTATRNLQEQIYFKDIPFIREHLHPQLRVTYMKGRQNYLCLRRFQELNSRLPGLHEDGAELERIGRWLEDTGMGDRSELEWMADDDPLWRQLDAGSDTCTGQKCAHYSACWVTRMRQRAVESDLIVVNHALFFANLALESDEIGRVLPDFSVLILDEAHEVAATAAGHFGRRVSLNQVEVFCRDALRILGDREGYRDLVSGVESRASTLFEGLPGAPGRHSLNNFPTPEGPADLRAELAGPRRDLEDYLQRLYHRMMRESDLGAEADPLLRRLEHLLAGLDEIFNQDAAESVYWFERRGRGIFLHVNPIDVAPILREKLFPRTDSIVFTSATLSTGRNFDYIKDSLGIEEPLEAILPGEFDYSSQSILYVPRAFPEPRSPGYPDRALEEMESILEITRGHAFLLFTSVAQMQRFHEQLSLRVSYPLLCQGEMPRNRLLDLFKRTPQAVLCATSSFWQGVDVRGDALRAVVIDKLPFQAPSEPLVAARIGYLESRGENPFLSYTVPEAVITLKQGLGRLIRSRTDRGILAVLDSRLRTRRYGRLFLESLPDCPLTDSMDELKSFFGSHG